MDVTIYKATLSKAQKTMRELKARGYLAKLQGTRGFWEITVLDTGKADFQTRVHRITDSI